MHQFSCYENFMQQNEIVDYFWNFARPAVHLCLVLKSDTISTFESH